MAAEVDGAADAPDAEDETRVRPLPRAPSPSRPRTWSPRLRRQGLFVCWRSALPRRAAPRADKGKGSGREGTGEPVGTGGRRPPPRVIWILAMNALLPLFTMAAAGADHHAANVLAAARALTPQLNRSRSLDRRLVAGVMTTTFGGSDTEGAWLWRDAYDAIEAALVLQLRRLAPQIGRLEDAPAEICALLANLCGPEPDPLATVRGAAGAGPVLHPAAARRPGGPGRPGARRRPRAGALRRDRPPRGAGRGLWRIGVPERGQRRAGCAAGGPVPAGSPLPARRRASERPPARPRAAFTSPWSIRRSRRWRPTCTPPSTAWPRGDGWPPSSRRACSTTRRGCASWPSAAASNCGWRSWTGPTPNTARR